MEELFERRVLLISGKGGVGRTTLSAGLAMAAAKKGKRVVVAEIGDPMLEFSPLARLFGRDGFDNEPVSVGENVWGVVLHARKGHERFLEVVVPVPALARAAMRSGALRRFFDAAPALNELGVFYHLLTLLRARDENGEDQFDLIVFDMPATGHSLALSGVPERVLSLMPVGPIADAMREGQSVIEDPDQTASWVVSLPEVLPVSESLELIEGLRADRIPVGGVLVNKVLEDAFDDEERAAIDEMIEGRHVFGAARYGSVAQCRESMDRLKSEGRVTLVAVPEFPDVGSGLLDHVVTSLLEPEIHRC